MSRKAHYLALLESIADEEVSELIALSREIVAERHTLSRDDREELAERIDARMKAAFALIRERYKKSG